MASIRKRVWTSGGTEKAAWIVDYKDQEGKRRLKTFTKKKEADAYRDRIKPEIRAGTHTPDSQSKLVSEACDLWLAYCNAEGLEYSTIRQRRQHIELHIKPYVGGVKLSELNGPMVRGFIDDLRDDGRSLAMRRKVLTNFKTILSHAQGRGLVAQNVARDVKIKRDKREKAKAMDRGGTMPTKNELRAMLDKVSDRWRPLIVTAIFTGMRASELRGLPWEHVDLDEEVIRVRQRADAWGTIAAPKSAAGVRDIPLAPMVVNTLKDWRSRQRKEWLVRVEKRPELRENGPPKLVFPNGNGNVENLANIFRRGFAPLQVECGITEGFTIKRGKNGKDEKIPKAKYGLHALRHAAASLFIEQGWTPKRVQTVIGHASIQMTYDLYGKLFKDPEDDRESMRQVEARLLAG